MLGPKWAMVNDNGQESSRLRLCKRVRPRDPSVLCASRPPGDVRKFRLGSFVSGLEERPWQARLSVGCCNRIGSDPVDLFRHASGCSQVCAWRSLLVCDKWDAPGTLSCGSGKAAVKS